MDHCGKTGFYCNAFVRFVFKSESGSLRAFPMSLLYVGLICSVTNKGVCVEACFLNVAITFF